MAFTFISMQKNGFMAKKMDQARYHNMKVKAILADNESDFLKIAKSQPVDFYLIPLDDSLSLVIPFLKELKQHPQTQDTPIIGQTFFQKENLSHELTSLLDEIIEEPVAQWVEKIRNYLSQQVRQYDRVETLLNHYPITVKAVLKEPPSPPRRGPMSLFMLDLSSGGMLVKSDQKKALIVGDEIQFFFQPKFEHVTLRGQAQVVRVSVDKKSRDEFYGLKFSQLDESVKKWMKGFIFWEKEMEKNVEDLFYRG